MRALSASVNLRPRSPVSHGHFSGIQEVDSSLLYPYVFVAGLAGPNKHDIMAEISTSQGWSHSLTRLIFPLPRVTLRKTRVPMSFNTLVWVSSARRVVQNLNLMTVRLNPACYSNTCIYHVSVLETKISRGDFVGYFFLSTDDTIQEQRIPLLIVMAKYVPPVLLATG